MGAHLPELSYAIHRTIGSLMARPSFKEAWTTFAH